jgi:hypothetical protein
MQTQCNASRNCKHAGASDKGTGKREEVPCRPDIRPHDSVCPAAYPNIAPKQASRKNVKPKSVTVLPHRPPLPPTPTIF